MQAFFWIVLQVTLGEVSHHDMLENCVSFLIFLAQIGITYFFFPFVFSFSPPHHVDVVPESVVVCRRGAVKP